MAQKRLQLLWWPSGLPRTPGILLACLTLGRRRRAKPTLLSKLLSPSSEMVLTSCSHVRNSYRNNPHGFSARMHAAVGGGP